MLARHMLSSRVCPSVRPSVRHKPVLYRNHSTNRAGLWHGGFLPPIPHCVVTKRGISKNYSTSLEDVVPNCGLRKFRQGNSIALSTTLVVDTYGRVCWRHLYNNRWVVVVYWKSVKCNPLTPIYCDLLWICCTTCYTVDIILTCMARRAVRLRQQSFL